MLKAGWGVFHKHVINHCTVPCVLWFSVEVDLPLDIKKDRNSKLQCYVTALHFSLTVSVESVL